jgi:hypothetical protein
MLRLLSRRVMLTSFSLLIALVNAPSAFAQRPLIGSLDGAWEGTLHDIAGRGLDVVPNQPPGVFRIFLQDEIVQIFIRESDAFVEVKPGRFTVQRRGSNAIISSIDNDPGSPLGSSWVETWTFAVTLKDTNTLIVNYLRVVNNNQLEATVDGARFTLMRTGEFQRIDVENV